LVVDEASMMDSTELHRIRQWRERLGFRVVYIGDAEQLPPVGMEKSPVFSAGIEEIQLTEVMRQRGGNPLLDLLTDIRLGKNPSVVASLNEQTGEGVVLAQNKTVALQAITSLSSPEIVRANMNQLRVLAGRNRVVREWNGLVHGILFPSGTSPVSRGEVVIGYRNTEELRNGVEYFVDYVSDLKSFSHRYTGFMAEGWDVVLKSDPGSAAAVKVFLVSKDHEDKYAQQVQMLSDRKQEAWRIWHDSGRDKDKVKAAIMATKALEQFTGNIGIMNDISIDWSVGNLEEAEKSSLRRMFDLGYASTVHKAQGGTVNVVVVDMDDISSFPGDQPFKRKLVYTALSRASKATVIVRSAYMTSGDLLERLVRIGASPLFYSVMPPSFVVEDASRYGRGVVPLAGHGLAVLGRMGKLV
jgi:ATP-dependent exoDNAse (exonuclease V) alpha subunit